MFFHKDPLKLMQEMKGWMQLNDLKTMFISRIPGGYRALEPGEEHYGTVIAVLEQGSTKDRN
ncbi:hypothetical protein [uncultured Mediterranean phage uvMED]|nr:hypothetical protein [uncultured Mediterranean phage uvMED]